MYSNFLVLFQLLLLVESVRLIQKPIYDDTKCDEDRSEGDCNVQKCVVSGFGHACEARFVRFTVNGEQSSRKMCRCLSESICTPMDLARIGCTTYKNMTNRMQRTIRRWTMTEEEKNAGSKQYGNEYRSASKGNIVYSDQERHYQLLTGTTKFCCRIDKSQRRYSFKRPVNSKRNTVPGRSLSSAEFLSILFSFLLNLQAYH